MDDLSNKLISIENKLGGTEPIPAGTEDKLGWHLDYIESLIDSGSGGETKLYRHNIVCKISDYNFYAGVGSHIFDGIVFIITNKQSLTLDELNQEINKNICSIVVYKDAGKVERVSYITTGTNSANTWHTIKYENSTFSIVTGGQFENINEITTDTVTEL